MHYAKYGKGSVAVVLQHSDRGIDSPDTHHHSNEFIDPNRTHLNYDLKDRNGLTAYQYYKQKIDEIAEETRQRTGKNIRKDAVTLCSWVVTRPTDIPEERQEEFFKGVYDWFAKRYGEDNIVTAAVHNDETTPHMHFQFVPIIEKNGVRKLCAKELETQRTLGTVHQKLQADLERSMGCKVGLLNGATDKGNKSVMQLKSELKNDVDSLQKEIASLQKERDEKQRELTKICGKAKALSLDEKKGALESKKAYEYRQSLYAREQLISQREQSLNQREQACKDEEHSLTIRSSSIEHTLNKREQNLKAKEQELEQTIAKQVQARFDKQMQDMFGGVATKRSERLENFCDEIMLENGESVLSAFERQEEQLKKRSKQR